MRSSLRVLATAAMLMPILITASADARERKLDAGLRVGIAAADGEPANDIPWAGVLVHYALAEPWTLGAAVDVAEYDFEEPAQIVGIVQDPGLEAIDAKAEATTVRVWIERALFDSAGSDPGRPTTFFVGAGIGAAFVDVPDTVGPSASGQRFDIRTEVDTEILAAIMTGARRRFGERWYAELGVGLEQHFASWTVTDRISGAHSTIDDYLTWGAHVAVGWRW